MAENRPVCLGQCPGAWIGSFENLFLSARLFGCWCPSQFTVGYMVERIYMLLFGGPLRKDDSVPPVIISGFIPKYRNKDPECRPLSQGRDPVRKNPKQILAFCTLWPAPLDVWYAGGLIYTTTYIVKAQNTCTCVMECNLPSVLLQPYLRCLLICFQRIFNQREQLVFMKITVCWGMWRRFNW